MVTKPPTEVAQRISELTERYAENDDLQSFDILHMYPLEIAYPNGFYDSMFFQLVGFNTSLNQRRDLGQHDGLRFEADARVEIARVFADGSTLLRFREPVAAELFNEATIRAVDGVTE